MKFIETWKHKSPTNGFMFNKGFAMLIFSNGRCLLTGEYCSSPTAFSRYGVMIDIATDGFDIMVSTGNGNYELGIGTKV